ncbi:hypothetical protein [uncultured Dysosmobacter sp.]|uniref:hypothetical protein n=1 Tax=uncultured Dysosmobacter sp. TaxID=2591384 RepID=UPI00261B10DA|nr:hypothetical protein [uncultured Dysosmobacter sp.]
MGIIEIIDNVPRLLQYFVPGYVTVFIFEYLTIRQYSSSGKVVAGCVLSYILTSACQLLSERCGKCAILQIWQFQTLISCFAGLIIGILGAIIVKSERFMNLLISLFRISPKRDSLDEVLDGAIQRDVRIFFKNGQDSICGHYCGRDSKGDDRWIIVTGFVVMGDDGEVLRKFDDDVIFMCRVQDIDHIIVTS